MTAFKVWMIDCKVKGANVCTRLTHREGNNSMKSISELVTAAHENALSKGWWEEDRRFGEIIVLIRSEVSEALEDYRNGELPTTVWYEGKEFDKTVRSSRLDAICQKPCGIPSELADVIIRIYDCCGRYGWAERFEEVYNQIQNLEIEIPEVCASSLLPFAENLEIINGWLTDAYRANKPYDIVYYLALAAADTRLLAEKNMIDLDQAITEKMAYNATRPQRHGGKVI